MSSNNAFFVRARMVRTLQRLIYGGMIASLMLGLAPAQADDVNKLEEDWELVVSTPDAQSCAPQVTTTFSPSGGLDSFYGVLDLNLRNLSIYEAGGLQLQLWNGKNPWLAIKTNTGTVLQDQNETVTWTQRATLNGGQLTFAIVNGQSNSWGSFGGDGFSLSIASDLQNFNSYSPAVSVSNSGVGFAGNRVTSLRLVEVRAYSGSDLMAQDRTVRVVFPHD